MSGRAEIATERIPGHPGEVPARPTRRGPARPASGTRPPGLWPAPPSPRSPRARRCPRRRPAPPRRGVLPGPAMRPVGHASLTSCRGMVRSDSSPGKRSVLPRKAVKGRAPREGVGWWRGGKGCGTPPRSGDPLDSLRSLRASSELLGEFPQAGGDLGDDPVRGGGAGGDADAGGVGDPGWRRVRPRSRCGGWGCRWRRRSLRRRAVLALLRPPTTIITSTLARPGRGRSPGASWWLRRWC